MINLSFFSVKKIESINLYYEVQMKKIFYYSIMYASCAMLYIPNSFIWPFYEFKNPMNKIFRIWRYATITIIVSLLTLSIFVLGCTTDSIPKKNKKSAVINDPIVTYWYCWWRINRYCTVSSGFELIHR